MHAFYPVQLLLRSLIFLLLTMPASFAFAAVTTSPIFRSNMVLQRGTAVPVFGTADAGAIVSVQFLGQLSSTIADANGKWRVDLPAMTATTSPQLMTVSSNGITITFTGVQVGEVWLCSGQSNMGFPLSNANGGAAAIADAANHNIRLFRMTAGNGPATTSWQVSNANTTGNFSAVAYWMGLELSKWFGNIPVGLIQATHDGTAIEHWQHTSGGSGDDYDAMVKAIQPYAIKGVAWYQGESNGGDAQYAGKLTNLINEWRSNWGLSNLPFGIIQLAYRSGWNVCRNAQLEVADALPNCFLVVIRDLPGSALHPPEKKPVGIRTAIGARGLVYGDNIEWSGPIRDIPYSFVSGNKVILNWKHLGNGLFTSDGKPPGEFKLAGATGQLKSATAVIVGNTLEVSSSFVSRPAKVQYSYSGTGNLYNRVNILTEGGTLVVDRLKVSEFQINVSSQAASAATELSTTNERVTGGVSIFPNPSAGEFFISLRETSVTGKLSVEISDMAGRIVFRKTDKASALIHVKLSLLPGVYILNVKENGILIMTEKIVRLQK
jgi:sialate O-acetylesterase